MELLGKSREQLREWLVEMGEPAYRGDQIYRALYQERNFEIAKMTALPAALREKLAREATVMLPSVRQRYFSKDGSKRCGCRARTGKRFAFRRRQDARWIASFV